MATGTIKRHDTEPSPRLTINSSGGGPYDLTNHYARMLMIRETQLSTAVTDIETDIELPAVLGRVIEVGDIILVENERMEVTVLPTLPITTPNGTWTVTRGVNVAARAGQVYGSTDVNGGGANQYRLSADADFDLSVDGSAPGTVTVLAAETTTNNTMAELVADVQTAIGIAGLNVTASAANDKLLFTSDSTGASSNVTLSTVSTEAAAELGLVAAYGAGAAAWPTDNVAHAAAVTATVIKIERTAIIEHPATSGRLTFEWVAGDTDKLGEFVLEFEVKTPQGKKFTAPNNNTFTVEFVRDLNDM